MADESRAEEQPLLGREGDALQPDDKPVYYNLWIGTGTVAQAGAWILAAITWGAVFSADLSLFSAHPLLNSASLLLLVQGILVLQPTHTAKQKKEGTWSHAGLNEVGTLAAVAGLIVIEYNKFAGGARHFTSIHGKIGLVVYIMIFLQAIVGFTQYFVPAMYGGVDNAKAIYKYHRVFGYITLLMMLVAMCSATQTGTNMSLLGIQLWAVIVSSVIIVVGIFPRIRLSKFGWMAGK